MDRRQFLQLSALFALSCATPSCTRLSPRYSLPERLYLAGESLLFTNASIIDVQKGTLRPERSLLIRNRVIEKLFPPDYRETVAADRTIDLKGVYVVPGLINAHCHMSLPGALELGSDLFFVYKRQLERNCEECVKHGVTTVRDMMAMTSHLDDLKEKISTGRVIGPRIISSCALDVKNGYSHNIPLVTKEKYWQEANTPSQAREAVRLACDKGADFIKLFQQPRRLLLPDGKHSVMDSQTIDAVCDEAARLGKTVALHHTETEGFNKGLRSGVNALEHMASDRRLTDEEIERISQSGAYIIPTASVAFALAYEMKGDPKWGTGRIPKMVQERREILPELIRDFSEPELVDGTLNIFNRFSDPESYEKHHLLPWPLPTVFTAAATTGTENAIALFNAGVPMGCGNDGGVPLIFPGAMTLEMTLLEELGFPPPDVLKMATYNNACLLGLENEIGSIKQGLRADMAFYKKNPLETVRNTNRPEMVMQNGRVVYSSN